MRIALDSYAKMPVHGRSSTRNTAMSTSTGKQRKES